MIDCTAEMKNDRKVGRPAKDDISGSFDMRRTILQASKPLFIDSPYEKVSMRKVAKLSGVSPALVSYYFINKEGVYEAFLHELAQEQRKIFIDYKISQPGNIFETVFNTHCYLINKEPGVIKLVFRSFLTDNTFEKDMIHKFLIEPSVKFLRSILTHNNSHQESFFDGFLPGLMFTTALWQFVDPESREKLFSETFEEDMRKSIASMATDFLPQSSKKK